MRRFARWIPIGLVPVGLALLVLAGVRVGLASDDDNKEAQDLVLKLMQTMDKGDAAGTQAQAKAIADKYDDLEPVMHTMKPREEGGLGVGNDPENIGIELKIKAMDKKPLTAKEVTAQSAALEKMGKTVAAVAEVAKYKCPVPSKMGAKDPADWDKWIKEMREHAGDLAKAAKSKDPGAVEKVTSRLNGTCNDCHAVFK